MYHSTKTTNKSFINMWRYLQRNKIENNLFMLQTNRKDLVDFSIEKYNSMDKESPSFLIYRSKLIDEVKDNIWFYFRELVMVPDEYSITGYKHFELTPESMMMIYLYDKHKSFININMYNDNCLYFLWNYHKSMYNNELVLFNDHQKIEEVSSIVKKSIANMLCQIPIGSTQLISDGTNHSICCNIESFKRYYLNNNKPSFIDDIKNRFNVSLVKNDWVKNNYGIFILEKDVPFITYSYILDFIKKNEFNLYLNGLENMDSLETIALYNFLNLYFDFATSNIYDIDVSDLKRLYLI